MKSQTKKSISFSGAEDSNNSLKSPTSPPQDQQVVYEDQFINNISDDFLTESVDGRQTTFSADALDDLDLNLEEDNLKKDGLFVESDSNKLKIALKALQQVGEQIATVIRLLETGAVIEAQQELATLDCDITSDKEPVNGTREDLSLLKPIDGRVVEGVFDGRGMVGSDGKGYIVPPNYASKSKLVEGDMLKLTITPKGSFIYKQIGPIERSRLIGSLGYDQTIGEYYATSENRRWNVLKASVTYFKGEPGDEIVLLVPKNAPSHWAAVENVIKRNPLE
jgi:hypothetical protein